MKIGDLSARQIENARGIYEVAAEYGPVAGKAALMTAAAESSFLLYANDGTTKRKDVPQPARNVARQSLGYPHDAVAPKLPPDTPDGFWDTTADSVNYFQQRPMYGYGTMPELMDRAECVRIFIRGSNGGKGRTKYFLKSPTELSLAQRCQWTQGSEFPTGENYAPMELVADQLIARFGIPPTEKDWLDMVTKDEYTAGLREVVGEELKALRKENQELRASIARIDDRTAAIDPVIRETFNRADWTNTNVDRLLARPAREEEKS